jgi:protein disulfide isomerase
VFGHVTESSLFGDKNSGTIDIHKDGEVYTDSGAHQALLALIHRTRIQQRPKVFSEHWVNYLLDSAFPLVDKYSDIVFNRAEAKRKDLLVVFGGDEEANLAAKQVAEDNKDSLVVATDDSLDQATAWGASGNEKPTAVFVRTTKKPATFTVWNEDDEEDLNAKSLTAFLQSARDGSYSSFIKSEPVPAENDGPVTVLVGRNIGDVLKSGKDVFVEFYAPWCGHCKSLAPVWEELGQAYEDDDNVVIAKIDATANKLPSNVNVRGYPTLIFFTAKGKQLTYNGERQLADLQKWVDSKKTKKEKKEDKSEL